MSQKFLSEVNLQALNNATTDTDKFLVSDSGTIKYRTGAEVLSDIGAAPASGSTNYIQNQNASAQTANMWISGSARAGNAKIGDWATASSFARFGHVSYDGSSTFGFLQSSDSTCFINGTNNYFSATNNNIFETAAAERMRITASGNVGIGTTSPASLLQVDGATPFITINKTSGSTLGTTFKSSGTTVGELNLNTSSGEFKTSSGFSGYGGFLTYYTNGSEKMRVFSTGGVSIGTTSDLFYTSGRGTLTLNGSTDSIFTLANGGTFAAYMWASSSKLEISTNAQPIVLITNGGERMRITAAGKIGIGTSNPSSRFTVEDSTAFSWGFPSVASAKIGTPGTGGSFLVMTPSLNSSYESGFAVDGTYSGGKSVINLSAFGVYSGGPYSADIAFKTATNLTLSEKMRITNDGKVGIGTTSPSGRLQVSSATAGDDQIWLQSTTYTGGYSTLGYNANTGEFRIKQNDGGSAGITFYTGASASEKMRITPSGDVVVGTNSALLNASGRGNITINGSSQSVLTLATGGTWRSYLYSDGTNTFLGAANEAIFGTNGGTERMRITSAGDVGIGTSSPTAKLMALSNGAGWTGWIENQDTAGNGSGLVVRAASNSGGFTMLLQKQDATSTFAVTGSGNVGIGTASPDASAVLNLESTTQGFLLPRMGDTEMNNISSPAQGLMIFNLSVNAVCVFDGSTWQRLAYL